MATPQNATHTPARDGDGKPTRVQIGVVAVTALVMGNMIGAGIFTIPNQIGEFGWYGIVAFALTAVGALILGLVFASLARQIPRTGGPYAYTKAAFGTFPGFWIAWGYWIGLWTGQVAIAVTFVGYVGVFVPALRTSVAWSAVAAFAALWLVTGINVRGVKAAGSVAIVTTAVRVVPLLAVATVGWLYFHPGNLAPSLPAGQSAFSAVSLAATITLFAFLGLESGTVPAGNVVNPSRTIPRATIIGIAAVAVLYVVSTTVVMGVLPASQLESGTTAFADAGRSMWGSAGYYVVGFAGMVSTLGALSGFALLNGQVPFAAAADGLFPRRFALKNRFDAPWFGIVASSVLVSLFMGGGYIYTMTQGRSAAADGLATASILIATLTTVLPYAFCSVAEMILVFTRRDFAGKRIGKLVIIPALAFVYSLFIIRGSGGQSIEIGLLLMLVGLPAYALLVRSMKRAAHTEPQSAGKLVPPVTTPPTDA